jgi:hypothetical protein
VALVSGKQFEFQQIWDTGLESPDSTTHPNDFISQYPKDFILSFYPIGLGRLGAKAQALGHDLWALRVQPYLSMCWLVPYAASMS